VVSLPPNPAAKLSVREAHQRSGGVFGAIGYLRAASGATGAARTIRDRRFHRMGRDRTGVEGGAATGWRRHRVPAVKYPLSGSGGMTQGTSELRSFLVDDEPAVLKALSRVLQATGYATKTFCSAEVFLSEHDASIPGCAVLDLAMPVLNGLDVQATLAVRASTD
jgi:hypothetical protein